MKLSTVKKFGYIHVHGGRLFRVVHEHAVDTKGFCQIIREVNEKTGAVVNRSIDLAPTVTARAGDLAIEIVQHKTGKTLGYSYLSGPAIQLNTYQVRPDRYEMASIAPARLRPPTEEEMETEESFQSYAHYFRTQCVGMKTDLEVDVFAMEAHFTDADSGQNLADSLVDAYRLVPKDMPQGDEDKLRSHLVASIHAGKGKRAKHYHLHFQPPKDKSDSAITPFQAQLCHTFFAAVRAHVASA